MDAKNPMRYAELLRSGRWFGGLPEAFQQGLLAIAAVRTLAAEERLFARGDPPSGLYAVVDGSIRVGGVTEAGKEVLLALVEPPNWIGEIAVFDRAPRTHDGIAQRATVVLHVPQAPLDALLDAHPAWWRDLGLLVTAKLRLTFATLEDAASLPVAQRLARTLLLTAGALGEWTDRSRRVVEVSQEQLATMLATSRQTINAVLRDHAARGLLRVAYGQVELLDFDGLRRAAAGEE